MKTKYFYILFLCILYLGITNNVQGATVTLYTPNGQVIYAHTND